MSREKGADTVSISLKTYVDQRFADSEKAVQIALISQKESNIKTETAAERRFELLNELRQDVATKGQIEALEKIVAAQDEATKARHDALAKLVYIGLGVMLALQFVSQFLK